MRLINEIIFHCSDSLWGDRDVIDDWHKARGWDGIGYHYVIMNGVINSDSKYDNNVDGMIEVGRDILKQGAHVRGHNQNTIGICLIGKRWFSSNQLISIKNLVNDLRGTFTKLKITGHYEYDKSKTCPNVDMDWLRDYLNDNPVHILRRAHSPISAL